MVIFNSLLNLPPLMLCLARILDAIIIRMDASKSV